MEDYRSGTCGCAGPGASSGGATTVSIFLGQQVLAEYDNGVLPSAPTNEYIYAGGQRVMSEQSGVTDYWHYDHLSPRLRTDASGNVADQRGTFPFGESWYSPGQSPYMFTTYYRDYESGNDYAQARSYISRLARFSSPDPVPGSASDPQSLNAYSYVESDPANLADPLGLCPSPGICITVSAPYWPSGPSLPSTSAVFFGGAGPDDINAEGQIFARTGRGNSGSAAANNGLLSKLKSLANNPCVTSALGKGALSVGVDAIGLIPEAGGIARMIGHQAGYVGVVADQVGFKVVDAFGKSTGTVNGLAGLSDTSPQGLISTGLTVAGFIPGLGQLAAGASIVNDAIKTGIEIAQCHP